MKIYNRKEKSYEEIRQFGQGALAFLYGNAFGRLLLKIAVSPLVSSIYGWMNQRPKSAKKIPGFISEYNINTKDYEDREYTSFTDFFTRKIKEGARVIDRNAEILISPCDSKLLVYKIDSDLRVMVKGREYTLDELVAGKTDTDSFKGGWCLVYRLSMDDYHRYCFVDEGKMSDSYKIKGKLHTVSSLSSAYKIYKENTRVINELETNNFGKIIHIEVGALLVGKIKNRNVISFERGEEKGYFEPGGSTIVQFIEANTVSIDEDILEQSAAGIETKVYYGERVGKKC
ncbi:MAG: phosphatidylserine decarboxylase [Lachnospiraceae bacterium]|nr:phosphatidylserine decarboxylase [Lachnospiraceae bacterium]